MDGPRVSVMVLDIVVSGHGSCLMDFLGSVFPMATIDTPPPLDCYPSVGQLRLEIVVVAKPALWR